VLSLEYVLFLRVARGQVRRLPVKVWMLLLLVILAGCGPDSGVEETVLRPEDIPIGEWTNSLAFNVARDARVYPRQPPPEEPPPYFKERLAGTGERECVDVDALRRTGRPDRYDSWGWFRSGEFAAGNLVRGIEQRNPYVTRVWLSWEPLHARRMPGLLVWAVPVTGSTGMIPYREFEVRESVKDPRFHYYTGSLDLPAPGRWRLVATSGPDWGCFEFTLSG
jgi:hypothetical protein